MKILDKYIIKKFLKTFFFSIFLFTLISVVIDISEKTDDFVKSQLSVKEIIMLYYIGFIPYIISLLFPIFVFITVIFFTSKMTKNSENIAIIASGVSYNRWLRPFFITSIFLAALLFYFNIELVPKANVIRSNFQLKYVDNHSNYEALLRKSGDVYLKMDSHSFIGVNRFNEIRNQADKFFIFEIKNNRLTYNLRADNLLWDTSKKGWILNNVIERNLNNNGESVTFTNTLTKKIQLKPIDLIKDKYTKEKLTSTELYDLIKLETIRGSERINDLKIEYYRRQTTPITVILLTLIGAIIAGKKIRGDSGIHIAFGFCIAGTFIIADKFSSIFSIKGNFPPIIASWTPNLIFLVITYLLYKNKD